MTKKKSERKNGDDMYVSLLHNYIENEKYNINTTKRLIDEMSPNQRLSMPSRLEDYQSSLQLYKKLLKEDSQKLRSYQKLKQNERKLMESIIRKDHPALFWKE